MFNNSKEKELIMTILNTKKELNINMENYKYADPEQIDYYLYQIKANQSKLDYLIKMAKENTIRLNNVEKIKFEI